MVCIIHAGQNISAGCSLSGRFYVNSCLQPLVQLLPSSHMVSSRWPFTDALPSIITDAFGRFQLISAVYLKDWLRSRSWMSLSAEMLTLHITSTFRQQMVETAHIILLKEAEKPLYFCHMLHLRSWQLKWWWTLRCPSCHRRHQRPRWTNCASERSSGSVGPSWVVMLTTTSHVFVWRVCLASLARHLSFACAVEMFVLAQQMATTLRWGVSYCCRLRWASDCVPSPFNLASVNFVCHQTIKAIGYLMRQVSSVGRWWQSAQPVETAFNLQAAIVTF